MPSKRNLSTVWSSISPYCVLAYPLQQCGIYYLLRRMSCGKLRLSLGVRRARTDAAHVYHHRLNRSLRLFAQQASDSRLELAILGGVDERVDAAVHQAHYHDDVVVPAGHVGDVAGHHQQVVNATRRPAHDEPAADHQ